MFISHLNIAKNTHPKGSALLVALLVTGVLMVVTLGLTDLIIREMRLEADVSKAGKAYYAAESGIEQALLDVHQGLPGVQKNDVSTEFEDGTEYNFSVHGLSKTIPDLQGINYENDLRRTFKPLAQNETVTIPMFYTDEKGQIKHTKKFFVAYYMQPIDLSVPKLVLNDFDVLRWKIFGLNENGSTESISDYISAGDTNTAQTPRCFGTEFDSGPANGCQTNDTSATVFTPTGDQIVTCPLTAARTFYKYDLGGLLDKNSVEQACYALSGFFNDHKFNYLVLTNAVNLDLIKNSKNSTQPATEKEKKVLATIYYKVVALGEDNFPLNDVKITSVGKVGDIQQAIEVNVGREQFLPVFNFSLYRFDANK